MITEKQFSQQVEDLLEIYGWRWCHFRPARTEKGWRTAISGHEGFPDYIALRGKRQVVIELKSETGELFLEQAVWLEAFRLAQKEVHVWWPSDWDEIVETLGGD